MDTNKQVLWRKNFAKDLFKRLEISNDLEAFFIGGSVSRNVADEYSDLEICFTWKNRISDENRQKVQKSLQLDIYNFGTWENFKAPLSETHYIKDFQIDIVHITTEIVENTIKEVLFEFDRNNNKANLLETFQSCIPLYGESYVNEIRDKIKAYPEQLAVKIIKHYSQNFFKVDVALQIKRKNWIYVYRNFGGYLIQIYHIVEAINKQYHLGFKRMNVSLRTFDILPNGTINIFENLDNLPAEYIWKEIVRIKYEIIELINKYFPNIDTNFIYTNQKHRRKKIDFLELD